MYTPVAQGFQRVNELADEVCRLERVLLDDPSELQELAGLFPLGKSGPGLFPIDLDALNGLGRPRGFLAAWEGEGLTLFRLHL